MKQFSILLLSILFLSCSSDNDELIKQVAIQINFSQNWNGTTIEKPDLSNTEFSYIIGDEIKTETKLTIKELKYLISKITLTDGAGKTTTLDGYKLVDLSKGDLTHNLPEKISEGTYNLSMTFGFDNDDNYSQIYTDLANWTVPDMLGGGYHYMQLEGKFTTKENETESFAYHTISAYKATTKEKEDTSFSLDLGTINIKNDATVEIKMNVAQWFNNPNEWNLDELHEKLMGNFDAQKQMSENGQSGVFSLGTVTQ